MPLKLADVNGPGWRCGSAVFEDVRVLFEGSSTGDVDVDLVSSGIDERRQGQIRSAAVVPSIVKVSSIWRKKIEFDN